MSVPLFTNWLTGQPLALDDYYYTSIKSLGPAGQGADDSALINAALTSLGSGGILWFPKGTYLANNLAPVTGSRMMGFGASITKNANGPIMTLADDNQIQGISFRGNGSVYTGKGLVLSTGNDQRLLNTNIVDCQDYCLDISNDKGLRFQWIGGTTYQTTTTNDAIHVANGGATETNGDRTFIGLNCAGARLMYINAAQNTLVTSCDCINITMGDNSLKATLTGNRLATLAADFIIKGGDGSFMNNAVAGGITLAANAARNTLFGNTLLSGSVITDSSGVGSNRYQGSMVTVTPTWASDGNPQPAIVNGTLNANAARDGHYIVARVTLIIGAATTLGTNNWYFQLPAPFADNCSVDAHGAMYVLRSGVAFHVGTAFILAGTNKIYMVGETTANFFNPAVPWVWAVGDYVKFTLRYSTGVP